MDNISWIFLSFVFLVSIVHPVFASDAATHETILERITRLEERDRVQQNEINRLEERDQIQIKRIVHLEERDRLHKVAIDLLMERVRTQKDEINDIRKHMFIEKRNAPQNPSMRTPHLEEQRSKRRVLISDKFVNGANDHSDRRSNRESLQMGRIQRAENEMDVAFFATLTSQQTHVGVQQAILFDHVVTNIGSTYHNHLGSFIAPVSGTYVFSVSLLTWTQATTYTISKNGSAVSYIFCDARKSGFESTSQTVILTLNQNDDISVRNHDAEGQTYGNHYSTFAGFLLKQAYQDAIIG